MNLMKFPQGDRAEKANTLARPITPKSERRYEGRIAPISVPGDCKQGIKCVKRDQHDGPCWPEDER